jgi:hypothetical protein
MEEKYPHMDPEQRAQLLCDYTRDKRKEFIVGEPDGGRKRERPPMALVKELWDELTSGLPAGEVSRNSALFYAAKEMGYPAWEIEKVLDVGINRKEVFWKGQVMMEYSYKMSEAWATIEEAING